MLRVEDVHVLRHKVLVEGLSRRQAAREMGISRNTVRRYLTLPEPVRVEREPRRKPVLERVQPRLDALLEEWSGRTTAKQIGMRAGLFLTADTLGMTTPFGPLPSSNGLSSL